MEMVILQIFFLFEKEMKAFFWWVDSTGGQTVNVSSQTKGTVLLWHVQVTAYACITFFLALMVTLPLPQKKLNTIHPTETADAIYTQGRTDQSSPGYKEGGLVFQILCEKGRL